MTDKKFTDDELVVFIRDYSESNHYPPSIRECCERFEVELSTMHTRLRKLRDSGRIQWRPMSPRTLTVLK